MSDLMREAPIGQFLRFVTKNKLFKYPEELPGFQLPETYNTMLNEHSNEKLGPSRSDSENAGAEEAPKTAEALPELTHHATNRSIRSGDVEHAATLTRTRTRESTRPYTEERLEVEAELAVERTKSIAIMPTKTSDGTILVDWYTSDDPANPQNWSNKKRFFVSLIVCMYTFAVYTGSAIYTSGEQGVINRFGVSATSASLPLSLYVLAYGIGPSSSPHCPKSQLSAARQSIPSPSYSSSSSASPPLWSTTSPDSSFSVSSKASSAAPASPMVAQQCRTCTPPLSSLRAHLLGLSRLLRSRSWPALIWLCRHG